MKSSSQVAVEPAYRAARMPAARAIRPTTAPLVALDSGTVSASSEPPVSSESLESSVGVGVDVVTAVPLPE